MIFALIQTVLQGSSIVRYFLIAFDLLWCMSYEFKLEGVEVLVESLKTLQLLMSRHIE